MASLVGRAAAASGGRCSVGVGAGARRERRRRGSVAQTVLASLARYGEKLEAIVSLVAIGVLLLILNWFYHRVYWQENLQDLHQPQAADPRRSAGLSLVAAQVVGLVALGLLERLPRGLRDRALPAGADARGGRAHRAPGRRSRASRQSLARLLPRHRASSGKLPHKKDRRRGHAPREPCSHEVVPAPAHGSLAGLHARLPGAGTPAITRSRRAPSFDYAELWADAPWRGRVAAAQGEGVMDRRQPVLRARRGHRRRARRRSPSTTSSSTPARARRRTRRARCRST